MASYESVLQEYWGYSAFRGVQREIIDSICNGKDTLGLMPTGGGKSICFQVPALVLDGVGIVVTPLISLMKGQVLQLNKRGIRAEAVYSGMMHDDIVCVLDNTVLGAYKLLYISPERLSSELFLAKLVRMKKVSMIVVDEAHCVSQWGYDFRPSYLQIAKIRHIINHHVPVLALTATATPKVVEDIQERLEFGEKNVFSMSFERKNLIYVVRETGNKPEETLHILNSVPEGSAIVYTRSRRLTSEIARFLCENGMTAEAYHAGLTNAEKDLRQKNWMENRTRVMVATNAFGMGIDKPDVRLVIHFNIPDSIEAYFQEAGRAGRDGKDSYAVVLYDKDDAFILRNRVPQTYPDVEYVKQTYENVCYYLQVGIGEAMGKTFYFPLETFCRTFRQFPVHTDSALKLLNNAGYIEYHEEQDFKSAVHFVVSREGLYNVGGVDDKDHDAVIKALLRNYTGVFADFVYIEEMRLSHLTGLTPDRVYQVLKDLHRRRIIDFIPHRCTPTVSFVIPRQDTNEIFLPPMVYEDRKKDFQTRIDSMLKYVMGKDECRSMSLLKYFGEADACRCGRCDVCLDMKRKPTDKARKAITDVLADGKQHLLVEFEQMDVKENIGVMETLSQMIQDEELAADGAYIKTLNH